MNSWIRVICWWCISIFLVATLIGTRSGYLWSQERSKRAYMIAQKDDHKRPKTPKGGQSPENKRPTEKELRKQKEDSDAARRRWDENNKKVEKEEKEYKSKQKKEGI